MIRSDGDLADARWLAAPIIDGENIVAARGVYAPRAHCSVEQSAVTLLKKASASLHRNRSRAV